MSLLNDLSFIFVISAHVGALILVVWAPSVFRALTRYQVVTLILLWLILITLLAIAGMMITY